jgi:hypothetical protein
LVFAREAFASRSRQANDCLILSNARCALSFTLIQCGDRPPGRGDRSSLIPSPPVPCCRSPGTGLDDGADLKRVDEYASGRPRNSRSRLVLRMERSSKRRSSPSRGKGIRNLFKCTGLSIIFAKFYSCEYPQSLSGHGESLAPVPARPSANVSPLLSIVPKPPRN